MQLDPERGLPAPLVCRAIRQAAGVSTDEVARRVGVSGAAVRYWELGRNVPFERNRVRYLEVLEELRLEAATRLGEPVGAAL